MARAGTQRRQSTILIILAMVAALVPAMAIAPPAQADPVSDLVITGVIDGPLSGGIPKAIEVYVMNDVADLSIYGLGSANNGGGSDGEEFTFPAVSVTMGTYLHVASEAVGFLAFLGFSPDYTSSAASINGNDAIELFMNGVVVDVFGDIDTDGSGEPWEYEDGWAYRVDNTGPDGSTFAIGNWTFSGPGALAGETSNATAATPFPISTFFYTVEDLPPTVSGSDPASGDTGVAIDTDVAVTFSEDVTVGTSWYDLTCATSGSHTAVQSGGPQTYTLNPDSDFAYGETCTLTVVADQVTDLGDPGQQMETDVVIEFTIGLPACSITDLTKIHVIQGDEMSSPIVGQTVTIEGVVVGDFQTRQGLKGFFVQEEDQDADTNPATSEGIFVYDGSSPGVDVVEGEVVQVTGKVNEKYGLTRLENVSLVDNCGTTDTATPAEPALPVETAVFWERWEGMSVAFAQTLFATDNYNLGRYGEVELSSGARLDIPTNIVDSGTAANALQSLNDRNRIQLDDGRRWQNPTPLPPYVHGNGTLRTGDHVSGLIGVLGYDYGAYEVHPTIDIEFDVGNLRPPVPDVGGTLQVAAFNVLNYFTTIDDSGSICGPSGDQDCRGADTAEEFVRQRDKIASALGELDADIVGLMEIENNELESLADLVAVVNAEGNGVYEYIDTGFIGLDAIKVGLIYQPETVTPVGDFAILDSSVDPLFNDDKNRPALAQTFKENDTGETFTIIVNHLKSKGSDCDDLGDPDMGDGQGNCNLMRTSAAVALANWAATDPTGSDDFDYLITGDLNSYAQEDPIVALKNLGYSDLIADNNGIGIHSYVYYGQKGYLDHALATPSLTGRVTGAAFWGINADEPSALNYNNYNQDDLYNPDPYRSSDHDPVLVGLSLDVVAPTLAVSASPSRLWPPNHKYTTVDVTVEVSDNSASVDYEVVSVTSSEADCCIGDGDLPNDIVDLGEDQFDLRAERYAKPGRTYTITYRAWDPAGNEAFAETTVFVPHSQRHKKK